MRHANIGLPPAWDMIARRGLGRRGQGLNWIGAKRYEAVRRKGRLRKPGKAVKRRQHCIGICCTAPLLGCFLARNLRRGPALRRVGARVSAALWLRLWPNFQPDSRPHACQAEAPLFSDSTSSTYCCLAASCAVPLSAAHASYLYFPTMSVKPGLSPCTSPRVACL